MSRAACATQATISAASASDSATVAARRRSGPRRCRTTGAADRPPHLRVLDDRAGLHEQARRTPQTPPSCRTRPGAAARKALREDLRAGAVKAGVRAVEERRIGRDREQHRQHRPQPVAYGTARRAPVSDMDMQRKGVVAPRNVIEHVLDTVVVLGVDDVLVAKVGPRMRSRGATRRRLGRQENKRRRSSRWSGAAARSTPRPERISISRRISSPAIASPSVESRLRPRFSSKRAASPSSTGSSSANSSSRATVKSVEASRAVRRCQGRVPRRASGQVEVPRVKTGRRPGWSGTVTSGGTCRRASE